MRHRIRLQRVVSFVMAVVIFSTVLPVDALAAFAGFTGNKINTAEAGKYGYTYDSFYSKLEQDLTLFYNRAVNGYTDPNGIHFGGLSESKRSDAFIMENVLKYLVACQWAQYNYLAATNSGEPDPTKCFNAFYESDSTLPYSGLSDVVDKQLTDLLQRLKGVYTESKMVWGDGKGQPPVSGVFYNFPATSTNRGIFSPGGNDFITSIQTIVDKYLIPNIANALASDLTETQLDDVINGLYQGYRPRTIEEQAGEVAGAFSGYQLGAAGSESNPNRYIIFIGDDAACDVLRHKGITVPDMTGTSRAPTVENPIGYYCFPAFATEGIDYPDYSFIQAALAACTPADANYTLELYLLVGADHVNYGKINPSSIETDMNASVNTNIAEHIRVVSQNASVKSVTVLQLPPLSSTTFSHYTTESSSGSSLTDTTLEALGNACNVSLLHMNWATSKISYSGVDYSGYDNTTPEEGYKYVWGAAADKVWSVMEAALEPPPEDQLPSGPTGNNYDSVKVFSLYEKHQTELRTYFDVLAHVQDYADSLDSSGFADVAIDGVQYTAFFTEHNWECLNIDSKPLFGDLFTTGYTRDPIANISGSGVPDRGVTDDDIEQAQDPIQLFTNAIIQAGDIIVPNKTLDDADLNNLGYLVLTAGVVYDPFVSIAGDSYYISAILNELDCKDEENIQKVQKLLQEALARKKPLYVLEGGAGDWAKKEDILVAPTGDWRIAYLSDLLQHDEAVTRIYSVVKGGMSPSTVDANSWLYSMTDEGKPNPEGGVDDGAYTGSNGSTGATTVAGAQLVATGSQLSSPVLFSSGAKNGAWSGNQAGSATGYAASLGGLTTMIVHNAAQDAKSNPNVQKPDEVVLFMNGLGDIVLADGTIVLPAIANPCIYNYDTIQYEVETETAEESGILGVIAGGLAIAGGILITIGTGGAGAGAGAASVSTGIKMLLGVAISAAAKVGGVAAAGAAGATIGASFGHWLKNMSGEDAPEVVQEAYDTSCAYYPYTAAFMNHYPSVIINGSGKLAVLNPNDEGKYVIGVDQQGSVVARRISGLQADGKQANLYYTGGGIIVAPLQPLSINMTTNVNAIATILPFMGGTDGELVTKFNTASKFEYFMVKDSLFSGDDQAYFPLTPPTSDLKDSYLKLAAPLRTSASRFISTRDSGGQTTTNFDAFDVRHYIVDMVGQGLQGTLYSETLQKNYKISYDELVADTGNRVLTFFVQLTDTAIEHLGKIDGVLAIKNGYENGFFNMIVNFVQEFYVLIACALMIIVAVKFMKGHYNIIFVAFVAALCICGFEVYANWMPSVVPGLYNFAVNDAIEQVVWNTVCVSAESYKETYKDSKRVDTATGTPKPYTATVTLYKMTRADMESVATALGVSYDKVKSGEALYLDENAGIFVQGDAIKLSVDRLLVNNAMRGLYQSQWEELASDFVSSDAFITPVTEDGDMIGNPYSLQLSNPYVSLEAYYMPFNEIERALLINLNSFASVFRMERNQFSYGKELYKDAFLFNCYTNSGIFLNPGSSESLKDNIRLGSVVGPYADTEDNYTALINRIYGYGANDGLFPYPEDWLNVSMVFRNPSNNMKNSLWGITMQKRGWYDTDWNITTKGVTELSDLIRYINEQTKLFVINNSSQLNFCSDENAIKIVSLYATTCFTHYTSEFGDWLYPNYLNAADIELRDVLYGSMTTLKDRNMASEESVVSTVAYNQGLFGVLFLLLITVFSVVFVFVMTYLVPILYAMFGLILIFKLVSSRDGVGLVQGYTKVTLVTCILYFIFSLSLRLVEVGGYAWYGYLGCAILMFLCCYFLFWVCLSVIQNIGEMGNETLAANLLQGFEKITGGAVSKLMANTLYARRGYNRTQSGRFVNAYQYGRGYGVDGRDYVRGSRRGRGLFGGLGSYGRGSGLDEGADPIGSRRTGGQRLVEGAARLQGGMSRYANTSRRGQ